MPDAHSPPEPAAEAFPAGPLPRLRFGSPDSLDADALYVADRLPDDVACKQFCSAGDDNRNLIVVREGVVAETYKGLPDETNNALLATYALHPQEHPNPVARAVTRIAPLKVVRAVRLVLSHLTRTAHREPVKAALRSLNLERRLEALARIDFAALDLPPDAAKAVAFQLGQTNALIDGVELYTKGGVRDRYPRLAPLIDRRPGSLAPLNDARDELLAKVRGVYVRQKGELNLLMYGNALAIDDWNLYARQCRGVVIDMARERCVQFPLDKFFRFGEGPELTREALPPDLPVEVVEKVDGSMVSLVEHGGARQFCCKGNFDTPQTERAAAIAQRLPVDKLDTGRYFHVFEVIYPENRYPHGLGVVDYGAREDLVLTAMRCRLTNELLPYSAVVAEARRVGLSHPRVFAGGLADVFRHVDEAAPHLHDEGFVIRSARDGKLFKLKYAGYKEVLRIVNELRTDRFVREYTALDADRRRWTLDLLPPDTRAVAEAHLSRLADLAARVNAYSEAVRAAAPTGRREFAEYVRATVPEDLQNLVFQQSRGRPAAALLEEAAVAAYYGKLAVPEAPAVG
jgi:hypothetical protein